LKSIVLCRNARPINDKRWAVEAIGCDESHRFIGKNGTGGAKGALYCSIHGHLQRAKGGLSPKVVSRDVTVAA
jgi:hypothetical protein